MPAKLINGKLMAHTMKRYWPLWTAFFAAWALGLLMPLMLLAPQASYIAGANVAQTMSIGWMFEYGAALAGVTVVSLVAALLVFEHLFNKRAAIFYGAAPVSRTSLFLTPFAAGLGAMVGVELLVFVLLGLLSLAYPVITLGEIATWLELTVGFTLVTYATAVLCVSLSGTRAMAVILYALAMGLGPTLVAVLVSIANTLFWGATLPLDTAFAWLSPVAGLAAYVLPTQMPMASGCHLALAGYAVVALLVAFGCLKLHDVRNLEVAGSQLAVPKAAPVLKLLLAAFVVAIFGVVALMSSVISAQGQMGTANVVVLTVIMVIGSVVGGFFAQGVVTRSTRSLRGGWKYAAVMSALCVAFVAGCAFDVMGVQGYVPKADQIESVVLDGDAALTSPDAVQQVTELHERILMLGPVEQQVQGIADEDLYSAPCDMTITYKMKDGSTVSRCYGYNAVLPANDPVAAEIESLRKTYAKLACSQEARESKMAPFLNAERGTVTVYVSSNGIEGGLLDSKTSDTFVQALAKDVREHGAYLGGSYWQEQCVTPDSDSLTTLVELNLFDGDKSSTVCLNPKTTPNAISCLESHFGTKLK
ncbi:MAG: hypothetical protein Q4D06_02635 [Coriobacteriia bacterium]|nr:hypothetical protein [Coriobacteriia bacterium]